MSVIALTDDTGAILERYAYDAYGETVFSNGSGTVISGSVEGNRYTYTGREWDADLALYHFRARMYDPEAGRFCSRDPIGYPGNDGGLYEYVDGNAPTRSDPSGMIPCLQKNSITVSLDDLTIHKEKANKWFGCTSIPSTIAGAAWLTKLVAKAMGYPLSKTWSIGPSPCPCNLTCQSVWKNTFSYTTSWVFVGTHRVVATDITGPDIDCDLTVSVKLKIDTSIDIGACK
jgi:RHS repeat-associated protein